MIDETEVSSVLQNYIADNWSGVDVAFSFEGQEFVPDRPYLAIEVEPLLSSDPTLDGSAEKLTQYLMVTAVTERGDFGAMAGEITKHIKSLFSHGKLFEISNAQITILKHPFVEGGYADGIDWRVPVRVDYEVCNHG